MSFSRGRANQQSSGHAAAGRLDEVGAGDGAECHLEGHLAVEPPEDQVLDSGRLRCPPKPIQPVHLGQNRNTCMPPVFQNRDTRTHPEQLLQGRWVRAGIDGGTTRSSNPLLRQSARGSRAADRPKPQLRPFILSGKDKGQKNHQRTALLVCSPRPETG